MPCSSEGKEVEMTTHVVRDDDTYGWNCGCWRIEMKVSFFHLAYVVLEGLESLGRVSFFSGVTALIMP